MLARRVMRSCASGGFSTTSPRMELRPVLWNSPSGVFVHRDMAPSPNFHEVEFCSILRFGKDGQVCNVNVSAELDDEVLSRYSKSCDAREKDREYGKYTFVNGTITFSLGRKRLFRSV